ncbi:MAG: hypothetical protein LC768_06565, partial [Acidobacteria bacterium]|nr:hypothetical protein [Acidobacteriota bacterium]
LLGLFSLSIRPNNLSVNNFDAFSKADRRFSMKYNQIMKIFIFIMVITTIAITITTLNIQGQKQQPRQDLSKDDTDNKLSYLPVVSYDDPKSENNKKEDKERKIKSKRYDKIQWVIKNPDPEPLGVGFGDESPPPPTIPIAESEIVIIGKVLNAEAHLSDSKGSVYSEFTIQVEEVLKSSKLYEITQGGSITIDSLGGAVQYPNGAKVYYFVVPIKELPHVGRRYVLFLTNVDKSPNFNILTGYELRGGKIYPLDSRERFQKLKGTSETEFITNIREMMAQPSEKINN